VSSGGIFGGANDRFFLAGRVFVHKLQFFIAIERLKGVAASGTVNSLFFRPFSVPACQITEFHALST
jgi:hypothetical protein